MKQIDVLCAWFFAIICSADANEDGSVLENAKIESVLEEGSMYKTDRD